ncbi:DoxX family protein, partial [Burkholderia multivorans]
LLGILPWLTVVSALGLALIQFLAIFAHRKHNEAFTMNIIVMVVALAVAVLRIAGV